MSHRAHLQCLNDANARSYSSNAMSPSSNPSPTMKASQPQRTTSQDSSSDGIRKRVCKACDRCRLKKSKCDGSHPCSRCKADNAICVFGERKKSHDKVYPKGYVEMLEQQQSQLVFGLRDMYTRLVAAKAWNGEELSESNGGPLTHDILAALGLLESKADGSGDMESFEEDCSKLQSRLIAEGAGYAHRRGSISSDSEHSQHSQHGNAQSPPHDTSTPQFFKNRGFNFSTPPSPLPSPNSLQQQRPTLPPAPRSQLQHDSPLAEDPQFYQAPWSYSGFANNQQLMMRGKLAVQTQVLDQGLELGTMDDFSSFDEWVQSPDPFDMKYDGNLYANLTSIPPQGANGYASMPRLQDGPASAITNEMDVDFGNFISVTS